MRSVSWIKARTRASELCVEVGPICDFNPISVLSDPGLVDLSIFLVRATMTVQTWTVGLRGVGGAVDAAIKKSLSSLANSSTLRRWFADRAPSAICCRTGGPAGDSDLRRK